MFIWLGNAVVDCNIISLLFIRQTANVLKISILWLVVYSTAFIEVTFWIFMIGSVEYIIHSQSWWAGVVWASPPLNGFRLRVAATVL